MNLVNTILTIIKSEHLWVCNKIKCLTSRGLLRISEIYHTVLDIIQVAKGIVAKGSVAKVSPKKPSIKTVLL